MSASELRELALDQRCVARHIMTASPHTTADEIADVLESAEIMERRADDQETGR